MSVRRGGWQIHEQQIFGSLSHTGGEGEATVTFTDDPEPFNSHGTVKRVTWAIENAAARERYWEEEARRVERSKEFVVKVRSLPSFCPPLASPAFSPHACGCLPPTHPRRPTPPRVKLPSAATLAWAGSVEGLAAELEGRGMRRVTLGWWERIGRRGRRIECA